MLTISLRYFDKIVRSNVHHVEVIEVEELQSQQQEVFSERLKQTRN